jgi:uncharacterized protein YbbC (DUF1343 family)
MCVQLRKLFPQEFEIERFNRLLVSQKVYDGFRNGADAKTLRQLWEEDLNSFRAIRRKYLLY